MQEVDWLPVRSSALDNDGIKTAVRDHGAVDVSMGWYGSSAGSSDYNATTKSYYYDGSSSTNHEVLVVGWDDAYAAANFATAPAGNGAFIVKNSWGTGWGSNGYFYVSYYDARFGRTTNPSAVFDQSEQTDNYSGIYQYDPLGDCAQYGFTNSTGWFANTFTAETTAALSAVGFYSLAPGTSYEVYAGSSLATKTLRTAAPRPTWGTTPSRCRTPVTVTKGQPFTVAVKVTSPGASYPIAIETPFDNYSSGATASTGQSYISLNGSSWTDIAGTFANTNVCLKAYVKPAGPGAISVTAPTGSTGHAQGSSLPVAWTTSQTVAGGQFSIWVVSPANGWYGGKIVAADGTASYANSVDLNVPVDAGYRRLRLLPRRARRPVGRLRLLAGDGQRDGRASMRSRSPLPPARAARTRARPCRSPGRPTRRSPAASSASGWSARRTAGTGARSTTPPTPSAPPATPTRST